MLQMQKKENFSASQILKFVIPSLFGVLLLMTPFKVDGQSTVMVSIMSKSINSFINSIIPIYYVILFVITVSCLLSLFYKLAKPEFIEKSDLLRSICDVSPFWLIVKFIGLILAFMTAFSLGPEIFWNENTGGLILFDLIGGLFTIFLVAGFILPLLTEFGLLEYVGVFLTSFMRPIFKLPGRSAIDCVASWIGDGTIGVALTNKQYEQGHYNAREAAVIATTFSAVSITFCLVVLENVNLLDYFAQYYLTVAVAGVVAALIMPRIPPLSTKPNKYITGEEVKANEIIPDGFTKKEWGLHMAVKRAESNTNIKNYMIKGSETVLNLWLGVIPVIMAVGTLALVISETTPIFSILGKPFYPILSLFQVPEAHAAADTMVIGFADMVVPSILAADIANPMTKFIVASVSVTQLLYMSETGAVIVGSKIPVNVLELFIIFIERTLITLPVIVLMAHLFF